MDAPTALSRRRLFWLGLLFEGGLGIAAWAAGRLNGHPLASELRWDARAALEGVLAALPMLLVFLACLWLPFRMFARIRAVVDDVIRPLFAGAALLDLAILSAAAGWGEECFFRGLVQGTAQRWTGAAIALPAASVLFGLVHPLTPGYVLLATALGAYLGGLWLLTDNLLAPVIAHALYDFAALTILLRYKMGPKQPRRDQSLQRHPLM